MLKMNETIDEENNIEMTSTQLEPVALYNIYSNISKTVLGEIYLTNTQRDILTKAFQHRGTYHQDLALLIVQK
jgi:hypothetical protein